MRWRCARSLVTPHLDHAPSWWYVVSLYGVSAAVIFVAAVAVSQRSLSRRLLARSPHHHQSLLALQGRLDMCGIAGIVNLRGAPVDAGRHLAADQPDRASRTVRRRHLVQREAETSPSAIADSPSSILAKAAISRWSSGDGRHVIVYNGEIYNFLELRRELEAKGAVFRSQSDTEVILAAWQAWGEDMLLRFNGMWALAIYDTTTDELFLAPRSLRHQAATVCAVVRAVRVRVRAAGAGAERADRGRRSTSTCARRLLDPFGIEGSERTLFGKLRRLQGGHCMWLRQGRGARSRRWWRTVDHLPDVPGTEAERVAALSRPVPGFRRAADAQRRSDRDLPVRRLRLRPR